MIDINGYARQHGISTATVRNRIKDGTLPAKKIGNKYFVLEPEDKKQGGLKLPEGVTLKDLKTSAEIKYLQQKIKENEEGVRSSERALMKEKMLKILSEINKGWRDCELTEKQCQLITAKFNKVKAKISEL